MSAPPLPWKNYTQWLIDLWTGTIRSEEKVLIVNIPAHDEAEFRRLCSKRGWWLEPEEAAPAPGTKESGTKRE